MVNQKFADQIELKKNKQPEQEVYSILDIMAIAKDTINGQPTRLYQFIYQKEETKAEDTWESVKKIPHL